MKRNLQHCTFLGGHPSNTTQSCLTRAGTFNMRVCSGITQPKSSRCCHLLWTWPNQSPSTCPSWGHIPHPWEVGQWLLETSNESCWWYLYLASDTKTAHFHRLYEVFTSPCTSYYHRNSGMTMFPNFIWLVYHLALQMAFFTEIY